MGLKNLSKAGGIKIMELPVYYSVLVGGPPGVGKYYFCLDLASKWLSNNENVIYITVERGPEIIKKDGENIGLDLSNLHYIDCYSWSVGKRFLLGLSSDKKIFGINSPTSLNEIANLLAKAVEKSGKPVRILFDSPSLLFLYNESQQILRFLQSLNNHVTAEYGSVLYTIQEGVHDPEVYNAIKSFVNGYMQLRFTEEKGQLKRQIRVHYLKNIDMSTEWRTFEIKKGFNIEKF